MSNSKNEKFDLNQAYETLKLLENAAGVPHLNTGGVEEKKVQILPDKSISRGNFKIHPFLENTYKAHPITIRAMRRDLFAAGMELFVDLEQLTQCQSCKSELDRQFWLFCPYCEEKFTS